ncbi:glycosyltransferase family 2 protein [Bacillus glycinifermentans]|uniref:Glycosyltransferase family 2 protein n=2 Tax=Bacillaceae TaxID=186817 RepID=A0AAJ3YY17_9BACI|nr:glycosyltransferase family 2 protein [Bacillus glycinifermentans]
MAFFCPKRAGQGMKMFSSSFLCENDLFIEIILMIGIIFLKNHSKGGEQMEPSVSIIIPVYNAEKYVSACLDSVLAQTLPHFEAIVVDDGSRDSSREIIKQYAARDDRIVPVFQDNAGPSTARNCALKMAKGEFVAFLDSDDWVEPDAYKEMYNAAIDNNADIVFTSLMWERWSGREAYPALFCPTKPAADERND